MESVHFDFLLSWNFTFAKSSYCCQICCPHDLRRTDVCQAISKGCVDDLVQRHVFGLWNDLFDGRLTTIGLLGKDVDHHEEHEFAWRTDHRMKASTSRVEPLKCPEKSFDRVRGAGRLIAAQRWS